MNALRSLSQAESTATWRLSSRLDVAVSLGAKPGQSFKDYVDFLDSEGRTPPKGRHWVDDIRGKGNEANYEIKIVSEEEGEATLYYRTYPAINLLSATLPQKGPKRDG